jgi:hypothetical protein
MFNIGDRVRMKSAPANGQWPQGAEIVKNRLVASREVFVLTNRIGNQDGYECFEGQLDNGNRYTIPIIHIELENTMPTETAVAEVIPEVKPKKATPGEKKFNKQKSVVRDAIIAATAQFVKKNGYDTAGTATMDAQQQAMFNELNYWRISISPDYSKRLAKMFTIMSGKVITDTPPPAKTINWIRFAAILPIVSGSSNAPLNKVCIIMADQYAIREDGTKSNALDNSTTHFRPASLGEIDLITNETYAALIREFLVMA